MAIRNQMSSDSSLDSDLRRIRLEDVADLARLMDVSFRGTIDYWGETLPQCEEEMLATINGKYGPFIEKSL